MQKGDIWPENREGVINQNRKYRLRTHPSNKEYRPSIQFIDTSRGLIKDYDAIFPDRYSEKLVEDINEVAVDHSGSPGGIFYVNEFKQVYKPVGHDEVTCIYVGEYPNLHFKFQIPDGSGFRTIDNNDISDLNPGDLWPHQNVGIRYRLIKRRGYWKSSYRIIGDNYIEKIFGAFDLREDILSTILEIKNGQGGQFYINEHGHIFCPNADVDDASDDYYCGSINIGLDDWFPKPGTN